MSDELRTLLHDAAPAPTRQVDPDRVHARRRRRDHVRTGAVVAATAAVIAVGIALLPSMSADAPMIDQEPQPQPSPTAPAATDETPTADAPTARAKPLSWPDGPSQSDSVAAEQGVPAEVAALPIADRLEVRGAVHVDGTLYVTSGLPFETADALAEIDARLSDGTAAYEYEEILAVDVDSLRVEQAWPTAGLSLVGDPLFLPSSQTLVAMRTGDGGEPWTSLMTIDLDTGTQRAWVELPSDVAVTDSAWQERDWVQVDTTGLPMVLLGEVDGHLAAADGDGMHLYDTETLTIVRSLVEADVEPTPAGDGVTLDLTGDQTDPEELTSSGLVPADLLSSPPGRAVDAVAIAPGLVTTYAEETPTLWVHSSTGWTQVAQDSFQAAGPIGLHTVDGRFAATSDAQLYLGDQHGVRLHAIASPPEPTALGRGTDVIAPGHPDGWLWLHGDVPFVVEDPSRTTDHDE